MVINKQLPIIEIGIPLIYVLSPYNIGGVSLSTILMLFIILNQYLKYNFCNLYLPLVHLFAFMFVHDICKMMVAGFNVGLWVERGIYLVFLLSIIGDVDEEKLYRIWKIIGIAAMMGMFIQAFQVYILHEPVSMIKLLPFLQSDSENYISEYMRPHSFFLEPAAYGTWILPLLCMSLFRNKIVFGVLVSVSILLSTSSIGIALTGIVWLFFIIVKKKNEETVSSRLIILTILMIGISVFVNMDIFADSLYKITNISINNTSNYVRLAFGFQLFLSLPFTYKIFGIPYANIETYLRSGKVNLWLFNLDIETKYLGFVNAIGNCMVTYGIFGLFFYLRLFWRLFRDIESEYYSILLITFISIFAQSVFWNGLFVTQFAVLLGCALKKDMKRMIWR